MIRRKLRRSILSRETISWRASHSLPILQPTGLPRLQSSPHLPPSDKLGSTRAPSQQVMRLLAHVARLASTPQGVGLVVAS